MTSYHGGKQKLGKQIALNIYDEIKGFNTKGYCEPFAGMLGVYQHIVELLPSDITFLAGDINESVIKMWNETTYNRWKPPVECDENYYDELKKLPESSAEKGFIGHHYSFGGQYFMGFREKYGIKRHSSQSSQKVLSISQKMKEKNCKFTSGSYDQFSGLKNFIIYCDPPYANSFLKYYDDKRQKINFDTNEFWEWVLEMSKNNIVFVSEYSIPDWIKPDKIISYDTKITGTNKERKENIYVFYPKIN